MLQNCPHLVRSRDAFTRRAHAGSPGRGPRLEALLFVAHVGRGPGRRVTKEELCCRLDLFTSGEWASLLYEANIAIRTQQKPVHREDSSDSRAAAACLKVQHQSPTVFDRSSIGSRERGHVEGDAIPQVQRPLPRQVLEFQPDSPVEVDRSTFVKSLKSAPKGSSPGQFGALTNICGC